jgi:hypothetical protein
MVQPRRSEVEPTPVAFWIAAAVVGAISLWTFFAAVVQVARGKSKPWSLDVVVAVLFHGGTAVLALWLANLAQNTPTPKGG